MFKYGCNFIARSKVFWDNISKHIYFKNEAKHSSKYCTYIKAFDISERNFIRPPFQNTYFSYKKPVILLGGVLSFFGLEKPPEESELIMKIKRGILSMQRGEFDKAETEFHIALKLAQDEKDEEGITYIYDMLANLAFETGNFKTAKTLFVEILKMLLEKGERQDSNKVIHISLKLAKAFQETQEKKLADEGYNFCISMLEKKIEDEERDEDTLALLGMSMDWYGKFLFSIGKKSEALGWLKRALEICTEVNGREHEQTVILLNDLGTVSSFLGDNETALSYFEQAKDIGNKLPEMEDLAAIYINIGQLYFIREMYKESKSACEEGLRRARRLNNDTSLSEAKECLKSIEKALKESKAMAI